MVYLLGRWMGAMGLGTHQTSMSTSTEQSARKVSLSEPVRSPVKLPVFEGPFHCY
jgi:hypothetical protein